jgi:transcriptional regulator with XRE-family HTH domain
MSEPRMTDTADLGRAVRSRRVARGLSTAELASAAGMSRRYVAALERGERNPRLDRLIAIAKALDMSVFALVIRATEEEGGSERAR